MRRNEIWNLRLCSREMEQKIKRLAEETGTSGAFAEILVKRGLADPLVALNFLTSSWDCLSDPMNLPGMEPAVKRLMEAIQNGDRIIIFGDYDVDGVCSVAALKETLTQLAIEVDHYIPNRFQEGYGLSPDAIMMASNNGYNLLITVDCGITSVEEVRLASELGLDVIVTDHHEPLEELPAAYAVVNPRLDPDNNSILCGAGVVFQLIRALAQEYTDLNVMEVLDLVTLATVADIVPMRGDNRIIVKQGLKYLHRTQRPGLHALMSSVGLMDRELGTWHIGYIIAPRINAAGRIGDANLAVRLLLTKDQTEASALAENLNDYNRMRQEIESEILKEASREAERCIERQEPVLVVAGESWHQGVIGIVASRLVDAYHRPAILISWEGEMGRGSGRSLKGFNLHQALFQCQDYLQRFGGHPLAAGISLNRDQFQDFRTAFNEVAATTEYHEGHSEINIDCEIDYDQITRELVQELARLEPYGEGNPEPRLLIRRTQILNPGAVGKNREHLKFWVGSQGQKIDAIAFRMTVPENWSYETQLYDLIFQPDINSYRGKESIQIKIHDLKPSDQFDFPINLSSGTEEEPVISRAEAAMKHGLNSGHPVVVVYPTLRSLEKHLTGLRGVFPAGLLIPLHGGMYRLIRKRSMESLINGNCQIFLTTYPFFRYYISKVGLRNNPKFIMLWPGDGIDLSGDTWQVFTLDTGVRIVGQEGNLDKYNEPTIIYANRRKTLHFSDSSDRVSNEAGETSLSRRLQARLRFLTGEADCLAWDGVIGGGLPTVNASRFVLADAPFGYYEIQNCLAQFSEPVKEIESSFTRESILFNRAFLSAQYPDRAVLENYYNRLAGAGRQKITREQIRNGAFSTEPGCAWPEVEFRAVLNVLADCNLCDYSYRETIYDVEIKKGSFSPVDSAFYIEGLEEKKVLVDFVKALGDTGMRLS